MKKANEKTVKLLQKIYEFVEPYGGQIGTKNPSVWWPLSITISDDEEGRENLKHVWMNLIQEINWDVLRDPGTEFFIKVDADNIIQEVDIVNMYSETVLGTEYVNEDTLEEQFANFIFTVVERAPYLNDYEYFMRY